MTEHQQHRMNKKVDELRKHVGELHFVALFGWAQKLLHMLHEKGVELPTLVDEMTSDDADEEQEEANRIAVEDHLHVMAEECKTLLFNPHLTRGPAVTMRGCREAATFWSDYTGNATAVKTEVFVEQMQQLLNEDASLLARGIITAGSVATNVAELAGRACDGYLHNAARMDSARCYRCSG